MTTPRKRLLESSLEFLDFVLEKAECKVESQIERQMFEALCLVKLIVYAEKLEPLSHAKARFSIFPQHQIGRYRVDFLITGCDTKNKIVVECDGHEFHEKTKDQAARDKSRDRYLQTEGYQVLRFTGSEIWRNSWICATDVAKALILARKREMGKE